MEQIPEEASEQKPRRRGRPRTRGITTQMNVRVDRDLKIRGDEVLRSAGSNPTDIISRLWGYVVRTGTVPGFLTDQDVEELQAEQSELRGQIDDVRGMPWRMLASELGGVGEQGCGLSLADVRNLCIGDEALRAREVAQS